MEKCEQNTEYASALIKLDEMRRDRERNDECLEIQGLDNKLRTQRRVIGEVNMNGINNI